MKLLKNIQTHKTKPLNNSTKLKTFKIAGSSISRRMEPFSKLYIEHHYCLLLGWKIKEGMKKKIKRERIGKYVEYFWQNYLRYHLYNEEHFLFGTFNNLRVRKAINQHTEIRELITALASSKKISGKKLLELATMLRTNIEYEETELFRYLSQTLCKADLKNVGEQIAQAHPTLGPDEYEDKFWITER